MSDVVVFFVVVFFVVVFFVVVVVFLLLLLLLLLIFLLLFLLMLLLKMRSDLFEAERALLADLFAKVKGLITCLINRLQAEAPSEASHTSYRDEGTSKVIQSLDEACEMARVVSEDAIVELGGVAEDLCKDSTLIVHFVTKSGAWAADHGLDHAVASGEFVGDQLQVSL